MLKTADRQRLTSIKVDGFRFLRTPTSRIDTFIHTSGGTVDFKLVPVAKATHWHGNRAYARA